MAIRDSVFDNEDLILIHRKTHPLCNRIFKDVSVSPPLAVMFFYHNEKQYKLVNNFSKGSKPPLRNGDHTLTHVGHLLYDADEIHKRFINGDFEIITYSGEEKFEIAMLRRKMIKQSKFSHKVLTFVKELANIDEG